jgi:hypothetical protein
VCVHWLCSLVWEYLKSWWVISHKILSKPKMWVSRENNSFNWVTGNKFR